MFGKKKNTNLPAPSVTVAPQMPSNDDFDDDFENLESEASDDEEVEEETEEEQEQEEEIQEEVIVPKKKVIAQKKVKVEQPEVKKEIQPQAPTVNDVLWNHESRIRAIEEAVEQRVKSIEASLYRLRSI